MGRGEGDLAAKKNYTFKHQSFPAEQPTVGVWISSCTRAHAPCCVHRTRSTATPTVRIAASSSARAKPNVYDFLVKMSVPANNIYLQQHARYVFYVKTTHDANAKKSINKPPLLATLDSICFIKILFFKLLLLWDPSATHFLARDRDFPAVSEREELLIWSIRTKSRIKASVKDAYLFSSSVSIR